MPTSIQKIILRSAACFTAVQEITACLFLTPKFLHQIWSTRGQPQGNTSLHELIKGTMLRRLDEHGNPNSAQPRDSPARAREEWIKFLVEAGGSMHKPNEARQTPIQLLCELNERIGRNLQTEAAH